LRRIADHLLAKKSAYAGLSRSRSIHLSRLAGSGSARNRRASSDEGSRPVTSSVTRRRNVASSHSGDGGNPSSLSFANTSSSMKLRAGGRFATGAPSGTVASNTATLSW
jgi:hypothetical protein